MTSKGAWQGRRLLPPGPDGLTVRRRAADGAAAPGTDEARSSCWRSVVIATQNPMDLNYGALSNVRVWCVGHERALLAPEAK